MNPLQRWLLFCVALLAYAAVLGVPHRELAAAAYLGAWVSALGLLCDATAR